jgi:hypothetical protein
MRGLKYYIYNDTEYLMIGTELCNDKVVMRVRNVKNNEESLVDLDYFHIKYKRSR